MVKKSKTPKKSKIVLKKKFTEWFGHKKVNLLVFMKMLWLLSANRCFQQQKMVPNWLSGDLIQPDLFLIFWVYYEFIGTHWHVGTSLVDHTGFNGVLVGLVGLMISRWSKFVCLSGLGFFYTPFMNCWCTSVLAVFLCCYIGGRPEPMVQKLQPPVFSELAFKTKGAVSGYLM